MDIHLSLFRGVATEGDRLVHLSRREAEFLFTMAAQHVGIRAHPPDVRHRVLAKRVRERFESPVLANAEAGAYRLADGVEVDLQHLRLAVLSSVRSVRRRAEVVERLGQALAALRGNPHRRAPWFAPIAEELELVGRQLLTELLGNASLASLI